MLHSCKQYLQHELYNISFSLNSNVRNLRQQIPIIYCNIYLICRYPYELLMCSGQYLDSQARHHVKNTSQDTRHSTVFNVQEGGKQLLQVMVWKTINLDLQNPTWKPRKTLSLIIQKFWHNILNCAVGRTNSFKYCLV